MASNLVIIDDKAEEDTNDDFIILEEFQDMADSGTSTIPEKQTFECLEKQSESFSSLGDSRINEQPYFESSRFIDQQLSLEKKRGLLGEGDGVEKRDECSEKGGSEVGRGKGEEVYGIRGDSVGGMGTSVDTSGVDVKGSWMYVQGESDDSMIECDKHGLVGTERRLLGGEPEVNTGDGGMLVKGDGQIKVCAGCSSAKDEVPINASPPCQESVATSPGDRTPEVRENLEPSQKINDNLSDDGDVEVLVDNETTTGLGGHMTDVKSGSLGSGYHPQPNKADVPILPNEPWQNLVMQQVDKHKPAAVDICGSGHSQANKAVQDVLLLHIPAEQDPAQVQASEAIQDDPLLTNQAKQNPALILMQNNNAEQNAPFLHNQAEQDPAQMQANKVKQDASLLLNPAEQYPAQMQVNEAVQDVPLLPKLAERKPALVLMQANKGKQDAAQMQANGGKQKAPSLPNEAKEDPAQVQANEAEQHEQVNEDNSQQDERPSQPIIHTQRPSYCSLLFLLAPILTAFAIFHLMNPKPLPPKPIIAINTKTHLPPSAKSWQLVANCTAFNSSYTVTYCQWKQIHPLPTSLENTVLPKGTKDCPPSSSPVDVDATLHDLKVPTDRGTYTFELACGHDSVNPATKRIEIWVNELIPPVISIGSHQITMSTSTGTTKLEASCKAVQGKLVERKWEYIDGPSEHIITPSLDGYVTLSKPGIYKFKYRCTDSFGGTALSSVITVTAKPPYVLGIDLGTSTTCIALIKEDGTRQDIGIYDDESDTDPCIPSVVAFALNGELLIGEKALRQAVVNPQATVYEVKRLMGRSYYDDAHHTFAYRVRPTLKSHSLKGVRAAVEIPCGRSRKKLVQPELISALILRHVADYAQTYLKVAVKDVVISVPAQFDDAQRKATMDAGLIAGLNPVKIVNEPTVAAFAANSMTEKLLAASENEQSAEEEKDRSTIWAVVADIGGGTTDYALMQIQGSYYKVITTDGDKTLGGRDIDIRLATLMTSILQDKYPGLDFINPIFIQKLRIECENAKIVLSEKEQYYLDVEYEDEKIGKLPLEHLLTRAEFEEHISGILEAMVKPLDSLLARSGGLSRANIEDLYLVGGTSHIPKLKELLLRYFSNVKNIRHEDPVQLVSRGAAAFGAALTGLVKVAKMPRIDAVPLPISIAVDMDDMHVIFERNRLYPCIEKRVLTTYTNNQNSIVIKVYEGEGRTADECHFLGEFDLSGIPPLPKNVPQIEATFKIDTNGILSVKASYGPVMKSMKLDVYSKSGGMVDKTREKMTLDLHRLMSPNSKDQSKCEVLEDATPMSVIPVKPRKSNVLKLSVDSEYDSVKMADSSDPNAMISAVGMVSVKGLVTDYDSLMMGTDLDIVLIVDTSGSMAGVPIATMKRVMLHVIDFLQENHRLGIVTFATSVYRNLELVSCTEGNKQNARNIVNGLYALGATNLYGGLSSGIQMAYRGGRRSRVLLFTDGYANEGLFINNDDIIRGIVRETTALASETQAQVTLSTFGYLGEHDESLLQDLATNIGVGTYNFLNENTALGSAFGQVLGDAIHTVAEKIQLTITPLDNVQILEAITHFNTGKNAGMLSFDIPNTADQQSRHVLLKLAVPPTREQAAHEGLFRVELTYINTLTEREEGSEEYLFVARTEKLDLETRSRDVDEQLNRVFVARQIEDALETLKSENREKAVELLREAQMKIQDSDSRSHTLSVCLSVDLEKLIHEVGDGDLNTAKKSLQDSLTSHWQEKGGRSSCYVTRKEDNLIKIFTS